MTLYAYKTCNNMKIVILFFAISTVFATHVWSQQNIVADSRLSEIYDQDYLNNLEQNNPQNLEYLNWYLDNSYKIVYAGIDKCKQMPYLKHLNIETKLPGENVSSINEENFNILIYSFEREYDKISHYRIGDTGYAIVFESHIKLAENFNKYQNEN